MSPTRPIRLVAAVSALVAGYAHVRLYSDGYSDIPVAHIGLQFLANAATAVVIAAALIATVFSDRIPAWVGRAAPIAGVGWAATSLLAFFLARASSGWLGYHDVPGLNPSPEAALAVFPEVIVLLTCASLLFFEFRPSGSTRTA